MLFTLSQLWIPNSLVSTCARYLFKKKNKKSFFETCLPRVWGASSASSVSAPTKTKPCPWPCLSDPQGRDVTSQFVQTSNQSQHQSVDTSFYEPQKSFESYLLKELTQPAWHLKIQYFLSRQLLHSSLSWFGLRSCVEVKSSRHIHRVTSLNHHLATFWGSKLFFLINIIIVSLTKYLFKLSQAAEPCVFCNYVPRDDKLSHLCASLFLGAFISGTFFFLFSFSFVQPINKSDLFAASCCGTCFISADRLRTPCLVCLCASLT